MTYRNHSSEAEAVVDEVERLGAHAVALPLDVADHSTFADFAARVEMLLQERWQRERFDFLVNNAGIGVHAGFTDTTETQFDQLLNVHFKGVFFLTQALLPLIADGGRIVNLSTGLTRFALPGYAAYAAMKGAIEVLTRYLAKELGPRGIAVNAVAPGAIETDFGGGVVGTTLRSMPSSPRKQHWAAPACRTISVVSSRHCWRTIIAGSAGSALRCRAVCSFEVRNEVRGVRPPTTEPHRRKSYL